MQTKKSTHAYRYVSDSLYTPISRSGQHNSYSLLYYLIPTVAPVARLLLGTRSNVTLSEYHNDNHKTSMNIDAYNNCLSNM